MKNLINSISKQVLINSVDIQTIHKSFTKKEYKKSTFLIEKGKRADKLYFIESGLVRMFFIDEKGNETNTYFAAENDFITSFSSFINQHTSVESIITHKKTIVYSLSYLDFKANNDFMIKFRTLFAEQNLVCIKNRLDLLQSSNAKEKYEHFIKNMNKEIINGIPLYHIASYLGITAESLSRLRRDIFLS